MKHKTPASFTDYVIQTTGIDPQLVNRANAEYLWRLINRHGIRVPPEIDEPVFKYLKGGYARTRRHTSTMVMEELSGSTILERLLGNEEEDGGLSAFVRDPKIMEYLRKPPFPQSL